MIFKVDIIIFIIQTLFLCLCPSFVKLFIFCKDFPANTWYSGAKKLLPQILIRCFVSHLNKSSYENISSTRIKISEINQSFPAFRGMEHPVDEHERVYSCALTSAPLGYWPLPGPPPRRASQTRRSKQRHFRFSLLGLHISWRIMCSTLPDVLGESLIGNAII